jgi:hypothetical protein
MQLQDNNGNTAVPVKFVVWWGEKKLQFWDDKAIVPVKQVKQGCHARGGGVNPKGGVEFPILFGID